MAETYQVTDDIVHSDGAKRRGATMGHARVARDVVEFKTRVELNGPLPRLKIMRWDRELRKRNAPPCAPEDDAATILR